MDRPFPWRCYYCSAKEVVRKPMQYETVIAYKDCEYNIVICDLQVPTCGKCGEMVFDNYAGEQIDKEFQRQIMANECGGGTVFS